MTRATRYLRRFVLFAIVLPILYGTVLGTAHGWPKNWRAANWDGSGVLPAPTATRDAQVIILAARTGHWKSIFAEHLAFVLKPEGATQWTRYEVVSWGDPVRKNAYAADAFWYSNTPRIIYHAKGPKAAQLIPKVEQAISRYPHQERGSYRVWPGPNSNTFVAWVIRHTEGFHAELPPVAVGKDWLGVAGFDRAPSGTGFTAALYGVLGLTVAREEGLEFHFFGSTIGIDVNDCAIKLPAVGKLAVFGG